MLNTTNLFAHITADPRLPLANPTESYWQQVQHPLANVKSSTLPEETDIAIIGSGISGMSAAKTVLENSPGVRLAINSAETYENMRNLVGVQMAGKIVRFYLRTLEKTRGLVRKHDIGEAQLVDVKKLRVCLDVQTWEKMERGVKLLEDDHPSLKGMYELVDANTCRQKFGIYTAVGGALLPAGTIWPYKLVCSVFQNLADIYGSLLNIETNTPVTSLSYAPDQSKTHPYLLSTPRGVVRAKHIIHCVNGYTGHLLPKLRGPIFPITGTMTVQDLGPEGPKLGQTMSWAIHQQPRMDPNGLFHDGLQYLAQNARTDLFFMGGDNVKLSQAVSANDDSVYPDSIKFLQRELSRLFGMDNSESRVVSAWSGVMGFSSDGMPIAGRLLPSVTGREGNGEWIAAAYNGYGMSTALSVAEHVASWVLGNPVDPSFPEAYLISDGRLGRSLTVHATMKMLEGDVGVAAASNQHKL
ncbi:hypothetical protein FSARC_10578 [Fusarium sarcochroum]|uniref:FAD dependent oxidoreductase domain-containing protein n=1 Tax=Fusarium sarcochroum TaxID=1208366 RepID=A0A8H4X2Y6_9HYPO|nr:hypothetical protein FSARC_10578 [Fusarium sarcochroum]